jgi:hypothetical protein
MFLNRDSATLMKTNGKRLAKELVHKEALQEFAQAETFSDMLSAIENILAQSQVYFDDEVLNLLNPENWKDFKALLMIYSMNEINGRDERRNVEERLGERVLDGASLEP